MHGSITTNIEVKVRLVLALLTKILYPRSIANFIIYILPHQVPRSRGTKFDCKWRHVYSDDTPLLTAVTTLSPSCFLMPDPSVIAMSRKSTSCHTSLLQLSESSSTVLCTVQPCKMSRVPQFLYGFCDKCMAINKMVSSAFIVIS